MANRFSVNPLGGFNVGGALASLGDTFKENRLMGQQEDKQAQLEQLRQRAFSGDPQAIQELSALDPNAAMQFQQGAQGREEQQYNALQKRTAEYIAKASAMPEDERQAYFESGITNPNLDIDEDDRVFFDNTDFAKAKIGEILGKEYAENIYGKGGGDVELPSAVKETEWFLKQPKEIQDKHIILKRKTDPTMAEKLKFAQDKSDIEVAETGKKEVAKSIEQRNQGYIDSGIDAADSLKGMTRALQLLDSVGTGGIDNALLAGKRLFGIESADEAELSANLGKAVLAQLKPIFGAAFTAAEGDRLEKIEAQFGKSTEGNKRLLKEVINKTKRAARRGLSAAKKSGDEFTAQEIQSLLDSLDSVNLNTDNDDKPQTAGAPQGALDALSADPSLIGQFKAKYGYTPEGY